MPRRSKDYIEVQKKLASANHEIFRLRSVMESDIKRARSAIGLLGRYRRIVGAYQEALLDLQGWKASSTAEIIHSEVWKVYEEAKAAGLVD